MKDTIFFETIKANDKKLFFIEYHNQRVKNTIGNSINLLESITLPSSELLRVKVIYDKNGIIDIEYHPYKKKDIKSIKIVKNNDIKYNYKYLNRTTIDDMLDKDFDEIIIVKNDLLTDTSIANIAILYKDRWITPKKPLLYGTTRERYIKNGILNEEDITLDMLKKAKKIATLNAMVDFNILDDITISW